MIYSKLNFVQYFTDDKEIHAVVNLADNTTTKLSVQGDKLDITVYEYVEGEEHDAKVLFGGQVLSGYCIYLDSGDIDKFDVEAVFLD